MDTVAAFPIELPFIAVGIVALVVGLIIGLMRRR
jgi:hypothetical protein